MTDTRHIVIVGGGLSGFTAAYRIACGLGQRKLKLTMLEAGVDVGGRARTVERGIDVGGAWVWPQNVEMIKLMKEIGVETFQHPGGSSGEVRVKGGMAEVVKAMQTRLISMAEKSGGQLEYSLQVGAKVSKVVLRQSHAVEVTYGSSKAIDQGSINPDEIEGFKLLSADHAVLALPPRLLAGTVTLLREQPTTGNVDPLLGESRLAAMRSQNIWMASTAKVAFEYEGPWWRSQLQRPVDHLRLRSHHVMQMMDASTADIAKDPSSKDGTSCLVAFAIPPPPPPSSLSLTNKTNGHTLWPSASFTITDPLTKLKDSVPGLPESARYWLKQVLDDVNQIPHILNLRVIDGMEDSTKFSTHPIRLHVHAWSHDTNIFHDDGRNPPGHPSYFQHPHDGGKNLREPILGLNTSETGKDVSTKVVPKILFASSETDDMYAGFLEGAVRAGNRVAREVKVVL
ncbi:hypothetical protein BC829DRAFT_395298, partial [Chytridium lagenaria]